MRAARVVSAAVEGIVDAAVIQKLITEYGGQPGTIYGQTGKDSLREKIAGYNNAAHHSPWVVVVDLDKDAVCAPRFRSAWIPHPAPLMCFRVVVRAVEAWLMADSQTLSAFLGIPRARVPAAPEHVVDPKRAMVDLARRSRKRAIRIDMVPREGSGRATGPAYATRLIEYVQSRWRPSFAAQNTDSLRRAVGCIRRLVDGT